MTRQCMFMVLLASLTGHAAANAQSWSVVAANQPNGVAARTGVQAQSGGAVIQPSEFIPHHPSLQPAAQRTRYGDFTASKSQGPMPAPCYPSKIMPPASGSGNKCDPILIPKNSVACAPTIVPTDLNIPLEGQTPVIPVRYNFYIKKASEKRQIQVPVIEERTTELFTFKRCTIDLTCCDVIVCIPNQRILQTDKACSFRGMFLNVEFRYRTSGGVDIVALKAPGMPAEWVLKEDATLKEVEEFKSTHPIGAAEKTSVSAE